MAFFALKFSELKNNARQAASGDPDARTPLGEIVNGALEYFVTLHQWTWRTAIQTLSFVAGDGRILLPDDFGELVDVVGFQAKYTAVRPGSWPQIVRTRVHGMLDGAYLLYHVTAQPVADATLPPKRCIEIAPLPAANQADALYVTYRRIVPMLAGDDDYPAIPYGLHGLLRTLVRAMAVSNTVQQAGHDWELFNQQIGNYIASDSLAEGQGGQLINALDGGDAATLRPHSGILLPGEPGY
jgi:hypothetical protein